MDKFTSLTGVAAPLPMINVDTDMIIPKQFLKTIARTGLGRSLFFEMRYDDAGEEFDDFVLNLPAYREAKILITGENFGCGSSREHAPWALLDFGIRCLIAPSFADIFYNNCFKNGILPIILPQKSVDALMAEAEQGANATFTADLEAELDGIAEGKLEWKAVLERFWQAFSSAVDNTKELRVSEVLDRLDEDLGSHFFPDGPNGESTRGCPRCSNGRLNLKLGKFGAFIGCSNYPDCRFTRQFAAPGGEDGEDGAAALDEPKILGKHAETDKDVSLRKGPYGFYVQLGEQGEKKSDKPKRVSLIRGMTPNEVTLDLALGLLSLPREIGAHPETGAMILADIGRFGPYLKLGPAYTSIPAGDDVLAIGLNRAVTLIAEKALKSPPAKQIGESDGKPVTVHSGRYGPYVQLGQVRATLPKDVEQETITLEKSLELIAAKAAKGPAKTKPAAKAKTTAKATKKPAAKKAGTKKAGSKKAATKAKPKATTETGNQPASND